MKIVFAGALFAVAALIANVSLAEEAPGAASPGPVDLLPADVQPCTDAGVELAAVAAMMPPGTGEEANRPPECPQAEPDDPEPDTASAAPDAQSVVAQPILVGPPPRNLTAQRIYRS